MAALRYGQDKLPKSWRPHANKAADLIEQWDDFQEGTITAGLMAVGVPYDVANGMAYWIVVFVGA
ncbi:hypothetical protein GCM10008096_16010 [Zhihengliuella salsuginis]|uniref:Uncharacterized protein n=1 Tax=Zhihengliuella salsuginis TaxID=578222 RepID=A0ABQ3GIA8_9MICC|nr:hypothetical protein GCM10008096_16010 [Zhihengliuella salsuginis]